MFVKVSFLFNVPIIYFKIKKELNKKNNVENITKTQRV